MSVLLPVAADKRLLSLSEYAHMIQHANIGAAIETPLDYAPALSELTGSEVFLKLETRQKIKAFKIRGAANKIASLSDEEKARGVITASAGNHAQGVSLAAKAWGVNATIVMPKITQNVKVNGVRRFNHGVNIVLHGNSFSEALQEAQRLQKEQGSTFVHPYDDPHVIAGQGTIAREIFVQTNQRVKYIFVPVGGGGLIAGTAIEAKFHHPETKIIAVEAKGSNCFYQAWYAGYRVIVDNLETFNDGTAVAQMGEEPYRVARELVDDVICVDDDATCVAAMEIHGDTGIMPETAGALSVAGMKEYLRQHPDQDDGINVCIVSGSNADPRRISYMAERYAIVTRREILLDIHLPEKPGSLKRLCDYLGNHSVTEFNYRCSSDDEAHILIGLSTNNYVTESAAALERLSKAGYNTTDITGDEVAREHLSHIVGGRPHRPLAAEQIYSFDFPEKPGALKEFLKALPDECDITLFHYRNHGAARGQVLMGLTAPPEQRAALQDFAENGGYNGKNVTNNKVCKDFLQCATSLPELAFG